MSTLPPVPPLDVKDSEAPAFGAKCPACQQRIRPPRAEPAAQAGPKQRSRIRIDIPVSEREHGADDFAHLVHRCAVKLRAGGMDYDESTPAWYVVFAVLQDWADTEELS